MKFFCGAFFHSPRGLHCMSACMHELIAIDGACDKEIDSGLYPQRLIFELDIVERSPHGIKAYKSSYSEC